MKTTIDIPTGTLAEVMRITKAKTKRDGVVRALDAFTRAQRVREMVDTFGRWDLPSNRELEAADTAEARRKART
jgi:Arc/MetJ family transcription regulator